MPYQTYASGSQTEILRNCFFQSFACKSLRRVAASSYHITFVPLSLSAVCSGTNHHESLVHSNVGHEERQEGHQYEPSRSKPFHKACDCLIQDQIVKLQCPPSTIDQRLAPCELCCLFWLEFCLFHPKIGARMQHIKSNPAAATKKQTHSKGRGT